MSVSQKKSICITPDEMSEIKQKAHARNQQKSRLAMSEILEKIELPPTTQNEIN